MTMLRLIAGSPRSGTSWVLNAVAEANDLRPVFEPLHPEAHESAANHESRLLRAIDSAPPLLHYWTRIARGDVRSIWTDLRIVPSHLAPLPTSRFPGSPRPGPWRVIGAWRRLGSRYLLTWKQRRRSRILVKCVRANLMLQWLAANTDLRCALILRHPAAVVESQLRHGYFGPHKQFGPDVRLKRMTGDEQLVSLVRERFGVSPVAPRSAAAALATIWCIENMVPLDHAGPSGLSVVFYEDLVQQKEAAWRALCDALGGTHLPSKKLLARPSEQSSVKGLKRLLARHSRYFTILDRWARRLADEDLRDIEGVLQTFGVYFYDLHSPLPNRTTFERDHGPISGR